MEKAEKGRYKRPPEDKREKSGSILGVMSVSILILGARTQKQSVISQLLHWGALESPRLGRQGLIIASKQEHPVRY
jgi:hypothetical protein